MANERDLREIGGQGVQTEDSMSQITQEPNPEKFPWRKNVLVLLSIAYLSMSLLFVVMVFSGMNPPDAYDKINPLLMALVGGTLATTKDLLH